MLLFDKMKKKGYINIHQGGRSAHVPCRDPQRQKEKRNVVNVAHLQTYVNFPMCFWVVVKRVMFQSWNSYLKGICPAYEMSTGNLLWWYKWHNQSSCWIFHHLNDQDNTVTTQGQKKFFEKVINPQAILEHIPVNI